MANLNSNCVEKFILIPQTKLDSIVKVLKERLPKSAHVYNCALRLSKNPGEFRMYTLNGDISSNSWILLVFDRIDVGQLFGISSPLNPTITSEIKQAFMNTHFINWNASYMFPALDREISSMIIEIGSSVKGKSFDVRPNYYYYMSTEDACKLETSWVDSKDGSLVKKSLDLDQGAHFITSNYKFAVEGSLEYAKAMITRHPSCGIYLNGKPVSGVLTHVNTLIGLLATDQNHRNQGYAIIVMKSLLRDLGEKGYVPSSCAQVENTASNKLHLKCGMKYSHECDYVIFVGLSEAN